MELHLELDVPWDFGTDMASEILSSVALLTTKRNLDLKSIERIDNRFFKIYWAGTVLRLDFPESSFRG